MISKEIKKQQLDILEVYKEAAEEDNTILPFLEVLEKRLTTLIRELNKEEDKE